MKIKLRKIISVLLLVIMVPAVFLYSFDKVETLEIKATMKKRHVLTITKTPGLDSLNVWDGSANKFEQQQCIANVKSNSREGFVLAFFSVNEGYLLHDDVISLAAMSGLTTAVMASNPSMAAFKVLYNIDVRASTVGPSNKMGGMIPGVIDGDLTEFKYLITDRHAVGTVDQDFLVSLKIGANILNDKLSGTYQDTVKIVLGNIGEHVHA